MEDLKGYMTKVIKNIAEDVMKDSIKNPKEIAFILKYKSKYKKANKRRESFEVKGKHIPPFIIGSIGNNSLYGAKSISKDKITSELGISEWRRVFNEAKELGVCCMLLSIGNTKRYNEIINEACKVKNIIFPILMDGTLLNNEMLEVFNNSRNLIPILNMCATRKENNEVMGKGSYNKVINSMNELYKKKIIYSVAINVNKDNLEDVCREDFIKSIYTKGCKAVVFFEQTLEPKARKTLEMKKDILRNKFNNMIVLSFPTDERYLGCLSAGRGFFHINTEGWVEPCPFSPCSDRNLKEVTLLQAIESPLFKKIQKGSSGCKIF